MATIKKMLSEIERISPTMFAALISGRSQLLGPAQDQCEQREQRDGQRDVQHVTHDGGLLMGIPDPRSNATDRRPQCRRLTQ